MYKKNSSGHKQPKEWLTKEEYFDKANLLKKGEIDPSNNFTVKADCYNLKISELRKMKEIENG